MSRTVSAQDQDSRNDPVRTCRAIPLVLVLPHQAHQKKNRIGPTFGLTAAYVDQVGESPPSPDDSILNPLWSLLKNVRFTYFTMVCRYCASEVDDNTAKIDAKKMDYQYMSSSCRLRRKNAVTGTYGLYAGQNPPKKSGFVGYST